MREIGTVRQVQVQQNRLKVGEKPNRYYDPAPLMIVDALEVTPQGVIGKTADGGSILDVHHTAHPNTRNQGANGISFNFTGHYQHIQSCFGTHMFDGCGGENILIALDGITTLENLGERIAIQSQDTGELLYLTEVMVAAPCLEFSRFALNQESPAPQTVQEALRTLHNGIRGFYAVVDSQKMVIHPGDKVMRALKRE